MTRRLFQSLGLTAAAACLVCGMHAHLRAQEAKPMPDVPTRPFLGTWQFPGMRVQSDTDMPKFASLIGRTNATYAQVFDYYAKKIGGHDYDLKQLAAFQPPGHSLISSISADIDTASPCYVDSQTMQATFSRRTAHMYVSIFLIQHKQSKETFISLTTATF